MYKIMHEGKIIDIVRNPSFIKFLPSGHIAITDKMSAQGIVGSDAKTVYSFEPVQHNDDITTVTIESITKDEFNRLQSLLNSDHVVRGDERALAKARESVIEVLSSMCNAKITSGFSIKLLDGNTYNFRLTAEDQLNLLSLENQLNAGENAFIYHATDLPCKVFSRDDMLKIIGAYRKHMLYHTTYFNTAKQYVNSLTDLEAVKSFTYGTDIAGVARESAVRKILLDGGVD